MKKNTNIADTGGESTTTAEASAQQTVAPGTPSGRSRANNRSRSRGSKRSPSLAGTGANAGINLGASEYGDLGSFVLACRQRGMNNQAILRDVGQYVEHFTVTI